MRRYIVRRLLQNLFLLWVLTSLMFILFRLLPGDPVSIILSADLSEESRRAVRESWGLDQPLWSQYATYVANLMVGEFGMSFHYQKPVWDVLEDKLINTLVLMIPSTVVAVVLGVLGGMYFGWRRGSRAEKLGVLLPPIIRGIPVFWLGILLLMAFSYGLNWFPNGGMRSMGTFVTGRWELFLSWDFLWHLTLPFLCMVITSLPEPMLIMRSSLLETKGEDYLELVEAKGVSEWVVLKHAARGSLLPVMTWVFHMFGYAIASTVVIEIVFAWPGLGREIVAAVNAYDYPVIQAAFFLISAIIISLNLVMDLLYGVLDPRVVIE
ncbi:MAG: ABC transporter permease [Xanthobacteraceae bacterium]